MMTSRTAHRFSFTAFAIAATLCVGLHASMLMGFNAMATANASIQAQTAKVDTVAPSVVLERVVVTSRRA